jgi:hypothetical protein
MLMLWAERSALIALEWLMPINSRELAVVSRRELVEVSLGRVEGSYEDFSLQALFIDACGLKRRVWMCEGSQEWWLEGG